MKRYFRNIVFTLTPLKSAYRFKDYFQIYPINLENSPQNKSARHFPCLIEYWVDDDEVKPVDALNSPVVNKMISKTTAQTNRVLEITNFLSSVTNYRFFIYRSPDQLWALPNPEEVTEEMNEWSSQWSVGLYYYPNMAKDLKISEFSSPECTTVKLLPKSYYYFYDPVEGHDKVIDFPDILDDTFEAYLSLSGKEKTVCDSAIYQLCNGLDLYPRMRSLSFLSVISGIETLVNYEFRNEKVVYECNDCKSLKSSSRTCKKCGSPIWGITAKFREFLFKYVSDKPEARKMYNKIYNVRSKIAHTEYLISGENYLNWNFDDKTEELGKQHLQAIQLCRRSISSWLINKE
ncbi:MAG: hypothetical protein ABJH98_12265 [Reichenbachiella sp.]|uniref:hypothetical protein n=1 Tax=Reichenbachiella sp. TaxID=2184521 RepID=UPI003297E20F